MTSSEPFANLLASKRADGRRGAIATSSPYASEAGRDVLAAGGNAADAAVAACLALAVADPANTGLAGRCHFLVADPGGAVHAIDGASVQPAGVPPLEGGEGLRTGHAAVPVPGNLAALDRISREFGRLPFADVATPALALARCGFSVPERLAAAWRRHGAQLAMDPGAHRHFLDPEGGTPAPGSVFCQPALAELLADLIEQGPANFYRGHVAEALSAANLAGGGFIEPSDLLAYEALDGEVLRFRCGESEVATVGRQAWGHTLAQMLQMLAALPCGLSTERATAAHALVILLALGDRPQEIGTLRSRPGGLPLEHLADPVFCRERAAAALRILERGPDAVAAALAEVPWSASDEGHHTTHLSVMDADGQTVAATTSIGPHFGARVAAADFGLLWAHSYAMAIEPKGGLRDQTEMTPVIVLRDGRPVLSTGAAGSERIPGATAQVVAAVLDQGRRVDEAVLGPRVNWSRRRLHVRSGETNALRASLEAAGFPLAKACAPHEARFGVVHATQFLADEGRFVAAADPDGDGTGLAL